MNSIILLQIIGIHLQSYLKVCITWSVVMKEHFLMQTDCSLQTAVFCCKGIKFFLSKIQNQEKIEVKFCMVNAVFWTDEAPIIWIKVTLNTQWPCVDIIRVLQIWLGIIREFLEKRTFMTFRSQSAHAPVLNRSFTLSSRNVSIILLYDRYQFKNCLFGE